MGAVGKGKREIEKEIYTYCEILIIRERKKKKDGKNKREK